MTQNFKKSKFLAFLFVVIASVLLLLFFHNRTWFTADDGYYAHVASRILHGEILDKNIEQHHGAYVHFLNALAFHFFGEDLVSLRYFLVLAGVIQACLVYFLFLPQGIFRAILAALLLTSLGFIQTPHPGASWYGLFFVILAIWMLERPFNETKKNFFLGLLLGINFLFRQLNAFFLAQGIMTVLLLKKNGMIQGRKEKSFLAQMIITIFLLLNVLYFFKYVPSDPFIFILFGFWPMLILFFILRKIRVTNQETIRQIVPIGVGVLTALLPLVWYAWKFEAGSDLLEGLWTRAFRNPALPHVKNSHYFDFFLVALANFRNLGLTYWMHSFYWLALLFAAFETGRRIYKNFHDHKILPEGMTIAFIGIFYALTTAFYQIPVYLYYTAGLSLIGFMSLLPRDRKTYYWSSIFFMLIIFIGIFFHAGRPPGRKFYEQALAGRSTPLEWNNRFPRASLWLETKDLESYGPLIRFIRGTTTPQETIFVIPYDSQIYFLSDRRNPFPFCRLSLSITNSAEVDRFLKKLQKENPKLVIDNAEGTFYREAIHEPIMEYVRSHYDLIQKFGPFHVYRARGLRKPLPV